MSDVLLEVDDLRTYFALPHGELRDTWTWFQSGLNTDGAHNPVTTRRVQRGEFGEGSLYTV